MKSKKILFPLFLLLAFAQLYIPAEMILNRNEVLNTGTEYKFKTQPIDPTDVFRGKYIDLRFGNNEFIVTNDSDWATNQTVYVSVIKDQNGLAKIAAVSKEVPADQVDYFKGKINNVNIIDGVVSLNIEFPFNRYYMEESKAYDAEMIYRETAPDTNQVVYALVNIKEGLSVLKDVQINGKSIKDIVKEMHLNN